MVILFFLFLFASLLWFFSKRLHWGLYIMAGLTPMIHWQFRLSDFRFLLRDYPQVLTFFAPMVDVWAVFMLMALAINLFRKFMRGEKISLSLPAGWFYFFFLLSAAVSLFNVLPGELWPSIKNIIRFPLFVYLGFLVFGLSAIDENEKILRRAMKVFVSVVFLGAIMGAVSLLIGVWNLDGLARAVPFAVYEFAPFGDQHIFLAEIFIPALLICLYFYYLGRERNERLGWLAIFFFILLVCLLTFSRAGWLTLFFMSALYAVIFKPQKALAFLARKIRLIMLLLLPFLIYMLLFLQSKVVQLSNEARIALTDIAWYLFKQHPIIGQGAGTFVSRVSDIHYFVYEFGAPIDAHSLISKLLAEQGIFGLLAFFAFIGWLLSKAHKRGEALAVMLISGAVFFQLFSTQYYSAVMWLPILFACGLLECKNRVI